MVALLLCGLLLAQEIVLSLSSERIEMGQTTQLSIEFINIDDAKPPHFPKDSGLSVELQNKNPEKNFVYQNGTSHHILRYRYTVLGVAEGVWNIGPVSLVYKGKSYVSNGVSVDVSTPGAESAKRTTVEGRLSKEAPYVGEVVSYRVRFSMRNKGIRTEVIPSQYVGLSSVASPNQKTSHVWEDEKLVEVLDIWFPLLVQNESRYEISSAKLLLETLKTGRDLPTSFFGEQREKKFFLSDPLMGVIRTRPSPPANFSGLVGSFQFRAYPRKKVVQVGEPVDVIVEIWGDGVLQGFRMPVFSDDRFEVFDERPQESVSFEKGEYSAKWTMKRTLLPIGGGKQAIDGFSLVVFDPKKEAYVELKSDPIVLRVQGEKKETPPKEVDQKPKEVPAWVEELPEKRSMPVPVWWSAWLLCVVPIVWMFGEREKAPSPPVLPRALPKNPDEKLRFLEQFINDYEVFCANSRAHDVPKSLRDVKESLYAARYGGVDVDDLEANIRDVLS